MYPNWFLPAPCCATVIVEPTIEAHLQQLQGEEDPILRQMQESGEERGFPIIGPLVGRLCEVLARAIGAKRVMELGSGFGYSTYHFARAVGEGGEVVHTDGDPGLSAEAKDWLQKGGLRDRVRFEVGDALQIAAREEGPFDIVFCDIDKGDYPRAWKWARDHVRIGGLVITDNTLWQGKVADPDDHEEWTQAVREYDRLAMQDDGFLTTIMPVRDGVAVSVRLR